MVELRKSQVKSPKKDDYRVDIIKKSPSPLKKRNDPKTLITNRDVNIINCNKDLIVHGARAQSQQKVTRAKTKPLTNDH